MVFFGRLTSTFTSAYSPATDVSNSEVSTHFIIKAIWKLIYFSIKPGFYFMVNAKFYNWLLSQSLLHFHELALRFQKPYLPFRNFRVPTIDKRLIEFAFLRDALVS